MIEIEITRQCRTLFKRALGSTSVGWRGRKQVWAKEEVELWCNPQKTLATPMGALELDGPSKLSWVGTRGLDLYTLALISDWLWATSGKRCNLEQSSCPLKRANSWVPLLTAEGVCHSFLQGHQSCTLHVHHRFFYVSTLTLIYMCLCLSDTSKLLGRRNCVLVSKALI